MKKYLFTLFFCTLLCGCRLEYKDISEDPEYVSLIGTSYSLTTNMYIYGVDLPPEYGKGIDVYIIKPMDIKITGREIITEEILELETIIDVQGVRKSINHFPGFQSIDVVIGVSPYENLTTIPVVMDLKYLESTKYMKESKDDMGGVAKSEQSLN